MLANYLIGLREGLEAALVVAILVAYLVRSGHRHLLAQVWLGLGIAVAVSLGFGALLTFGPSGLTFEAQEAVGGTLSILAVGLVTWMVFWMARTARHLKADLHSRLDRAFAAGRSAVLLVTLLAVGREGLETALFLWAAAEATGASSQPLLGAVLGLATAATLGWGIYRGAISVNLRVFFAWTGLVLIVVAGGVLAYGVHDLQEAGLLPGLGALAFDVSAAVPPQSWYGAVLKGVVNFSPATTWLEAAAWVAYVVPTTVLFARMVWPQPAARGGARTGGTPQATAHDGAAPVVRDARPETVPAPVG